MTDLYLLFWVAFLSLLESRRVAYWLFWLVVLVSGYWLDLAFRDVVYVGLLMHVVLMFIRLFTGLLDVPRLVSERW